jgi:hypothetical protein
MENINASLRLNGRAKKKFIHLVSGVESPSHKISLIRLELTHPESRGLLFEPIADLFHDRAHLFVVANICRDVQNSTFGARNGSGKNCLSPTTVLGILAFVNTLSEMSLSSQG